MRTLILSALFLGPLAALSTLAQADLYIWKDQKKTTIQEFWYPEGDSSRAELWTTREIWHGPNGRPDSARLRGREKNNQDVHLKYNEQGDLVERYHRLNDSLDLTYTWKYKYDEAGRMTEESSFDEANKLLSQQIRVYDQEGRLMDHAYFVRRLPEYQSWSFTFDEQGEKRHDATQLSYGPRYYRFDWKDRLFLEHLNPFSLLPSADVYQRYHFSYNSEGRLAQTELFDQLRVLMERDTFFYDGRGRVRSLKSYLPLDTLDLIWDFQYGDQGEIKLTRTVNMQDQSIVELFKTELEMEGERILSKRYNRVNNLSDQFFYGPGGKVTLHERRDIFGVLLESWTHDAEGRILLNRRYIDDEVLDVVRRYHYE
jgi:hypothetical protein